MKPGGILISITDALIGGQPVLSSYGFTNKLRESGHNGRTLWFKAM